MHSNQVSDDLMWNRIKISELALCDEGYQSRYKMVFKFEIEEELPHIIKQELNSMQIKTEFNRSPYNRIEYDLIDRLCFLDLILKMFKEQLLHLGNQLELSCSLFI
jgi:hypothetical protein